MKDQNTLSNKLDCIRMNMNSFQEDTLFFFSQTQQRG